MRLCPDGDSGDQSAADCFVWHGGRRHPDLCLLGDQSISSASKHGRIWTNIIFYIYLKSEFAQEMLCKDKNIYIGNFVHFG